MINGVEYDNLDCLQSGRKTRVHGDFLGCPVFIKSQLIISSFLEKLSGIIDTGF